MKILPKGDFLEELLIKMDSIFGNIKKYDEKIKEILQFQENEYRRGMISVINGLPVDEAILTFRRDLRESLFKFEHYLVSILIKKDYIDIESIFSKLESMNNTHHDVICEYYLDWHKDTEDSRQFIISFNYDLSIKEKENYRQLFAGHPNLLFNTGGSIEFDIESHEVERFKKFQFPGK